MHIHNYCCCILILIRLNSELFYSAMLFTGLCSISLCRYRETIKYSVKVSGTIVPEQHEGIVGRRHITPVIPNLATTRSNRSASRFRSFTTGKT